MATDKTPQVPWNEMQTQWRRNLLEHISHSLEFKAMLYNNKDGFASLEERYGLVCTRVQDSVVCNLKEDC